MKHRDSTSPRTRKIRALPLVWGASLLAALVMALSVNGTLAGWTQATVTNSTNTTKTGSAVVLKEVNGAATCSSDQDATNSYTCATINKYGGTGTPLMPGESSNVDVTFTNTGTANASTFVLQPGACTSTGGSVNLCTSGDLKVTVKCTDGATFGATPWSDLSIGPANPGAMANSTHTATLAAGATWTCRVTVTLQASAPVGAQGVTVSQPLTWTLNK